MLAGEDGYIVYMELNLQWDCCLMGVLSASRMAGRLDRQRRFSGAKLVTANLPMRYHPIDAKK